MKKQLILTVLVLIAISGCLNNIEEKKQNVSEVKVENVLLGKLWELQSFGTIDTELKVLPDTKGATQVRPMMDEFYGDRAGHVMDPFGYIWMIVTHKEDISFEEMQKRADKMFGELKYE